MSETQQSTLVLDAQDIGNEKRAEQVSELLRDVGKQPGVNAACKAAEVAEETFQRLHRRHTELNTEVTRLFNALKQARADFSATLCKPGTLPKDANAIGELETLYREMNAGYSVLLARHLPRAQVGALIKNAERLECFSRALNEAAIARMTKTIEALSPALLAEGNISFDPTRTLSGQLQRRAHEMLQEAAGLREQAEKIVTDCKLTEVSNG